MFLQYSLPLRYFSHKLHVIWTKQKTNNTKNAPWKIFLLSTMQTYFKTKMICNIHFYKRYTEYKSTTKIKQWLIQWRLYKKCASSIQINKHTIVTAVHIKRLCRVTGRKILVLCCMMANHFQVRSFRVKQHWRLFCRCVSARIHKGLLSDLTSNIR